MNRTHQLNGTRTTVTAKLSQLKGNAKPYFSITGEIYEGKRWSAGGCLHDDFVKIWPDLAPLIALHLSDIDGTPMHFVANGWYDLAGALGGCGERYHVGNSKRNFPVTAPADKPWCNTEHREPTEAECLQIFADHCRIPLAEAQAIAHEVKCALGPEQEDGIYPHRKSDYERAKAAWVRLAATMTERFNAEAAAIIKQFNLTVVHD